MFDVELKIKTIPKVIEVAKENLLTVIDGWSVSYLAGMWKGVEEDSVEISIVCNVDKSKEVVQIILQAASELGEETIMIGNNNSDGEFTVYTRAPPPITESNPNPSPNPSPNPNQDFILGPSWLMIS